MTVSQLIEWLKTQDQDATVEVVQHKSEGGYYQQGGTVRIVQFSPELSEYTDTRGNIFITPDLITIHEHFYWAYITDKKSLDIPCNLFILRPE